MKKEKRKSYRERYFEDYEAVRVPADNRRGYRVDYRYIGRWCSWESQGRSLRTVKLAVVGAEVLAIAVYFAAILSGAPVTKARLANGFGAISLVPWLLELTGAVRFVIAGPHVKELSCEEIGQSIRIGTVLRAALAALSMLVGGDRGPAGRKGDSRRHSGDRRRAGQRRGLGAGPVHVRKAAGDHLPEPERRAGQQDLTN